MEHMEHVEATTRRRQKERGIHPSHLRAWRRYRVMSQPELAQAVGLTRAAVSKLETQPDSTAKPETIGKLARALRISREQLIREAPPATDEDSAGAA